MEIVSLFPSQQEALFKSPFFMRLSKERISHILTDHSFQLRKYSVNSYFAQKEGLLTGLSIILSGEVTAEMINEVGNRFAVEVLTASSLIAPAFIFKEEALPIDILVSAPLTVLYIDKSSLLMLFQHQPTILENFLVILSRNIRILSEKLYFNFNCKTIEEKLLTYFQLHEKEGEVILPLTIETLAEQFQVSRPSLSRVIKRLIQEGKIEKLKPKRYRILS